MDAAAILAVVRRRLAQADLATSDFTDSELMEYVQESADILSLRPIPGMGDLVIDTVAITISPEPTKEQGYMLALMTVSRVLEDEYDGKLFRGELAVSWQSGLESETTISAEKAWAQALADLEVELDRMILVKMAPIAGARMQ